MSVFVDTSALYAVLDRDDSNHAAATGSFERLFGAEELVTHNYVHVEVEQLVRRRLGSRAAAILIDQLLPAMTTVWVDEALHSEALATIRSAGRAASLVDQVSFAVMRRSGIDEALAFDADFAAEGFRAVDRSGRGAGRLSEERAEYGDAHSSPPELVGLREMAARSGRSINTIQSWRRRHRTFPAPYVELAAGPIWEWRAVEAWLRDRGQRRRPA